MQIQTLFDQTLHEKLFKNFLFFFFFAEELIQALSWYQQTVKYNYSLLMKKVAANFIVIKNHR